MAVAMRRWSTRPAAAQRRRSQRCFIVIGVPPSERPTLSVTTATAPRTSPRKRFSPPSGRSERFDRRRPFAPWLHRIVVNRAIDFTRMRAARRETSTAAVPEPPYRQTDDPERRCAGRAGTPRSQSPRGDRDALRARLLAWRDRRGSRASARHGQLAAAPRARRARRSPRPRAGAGPVTEQELRELLRDARLGLDPRSEQRAWHVVRSAYQPRPARRTGWTVRRPVVAVATIAVVAILALGMVTAPRQAVAHWLRDAFGLTAPPHTTRGLGRPSGRRASARRDHERVVARHRRRQPPRSRHLHGRGVVASQPLCRGLARSTGSPRSVSPASLSGS